MRAAGRFKISPKHLDQLKGVFVTMIVVVMIVGVPLSSSRTGRERGRLRDMDASFRQLV